MDSTEDSNAGSTVDSTVDSTLGCNVEPTVDPTVGSTVKSAIDSVVGSTSPQCSSEPVPSALRYRAGALGSCGGLCEAMSVGARPRGKFLFFFSVSSPEMRRGTK